MNVRVGLQLDDKKQFNILCVIEYGKNVNKHLDYKNHDKNG